MRFIGEPLEDAAARSAFEAIMRAQGEEDSHRHYWRLATPDMPEAGLLSLHMKPAGRSAEFGVMLAGSARGRQLARPACRALLAHAFDRGALEVLHCRHRAAHAAMSRLATDLAFMRAAAPAGWRRIAAEPSPP